MIKVHQFTDAQGRILKLTEITESGLTLSSVSVYSLPELLLLINVLRDKYGDWVYDDNCLQKLRAAGENL